MLGGFGRTDMMPERGKTDVAVERTEPVLEESKLLGWGVGSW